MSPERADPSDPERCPPCRGTGQVISTLGGTPQKVTCPWCEGTGRRRPPEQAPPGEQEA